ncbi:lipid IV(A) 3-deoxy-D-manno-octulosonic acid transferase [Marinobacter caseinilyticus]|uniref:lipid IV(A) 3-deoxy-D-manno-octulosonic acid transferase n=1 Tax=Marinobacter caseinilyticus TaxID=2692195 RepID=UPI0014084189|nr:lipid IV(A) 3-deoxy-D-manno-octulosonic acid transferase [Marinobacter caseinilyticus]
MLHFLYSLFFRMALPFVLIRLWWQGRQSPETWAHWQQRLGFVPKSKEPVIWVHAVSVGETIAAAPLVTALLKRNPDIPILMTAMTATGSQRAKAMFGDQVQYAFSPYDTPGSVSRFVDRVRPRALVIMETELWPNMIALARQRQVPTFLINARLSSRSAKGYQRIISLVRPLLQSISWIAAQAEEDAKRFLRIGASPQTVSVTGSIKFDVAITPALRDTASALRHFLGAQRPVWIAASTHEGEDRQVLQAHRQLLEAVPDALLVIVPRHPERFDDVSELITEHGFSQARRSASTEANRVQVYLGDTMGELLMLFGASDIAFVGGSLIERGGHNPLEPAAWGIPVISGPHVFNFETIYQHLNAGDALRITHNSKELADCVTQLIQDQAAARQAGTNALKVVDDNRGALEKVVTGIIERV